jgi:hypothetical protein
MVDRVEISDLSRRKKQRIGIIGVSPTLPNAIESKFVKLTKSVEEINQNPENNWIYDQGGLSVGEYLYSRKGYQSAGISEY